MKDSPSEDVKPREIIFLREFPCNVSFPAQQEIAVLYLTSMCM